MPIQKTLTDLTILLIDDEVYNRDVIQMTLQLHGARCREAASAVQALQLLDRHTDFNVILSDLSMPIIDGWELYHQLRSRPDSADLPIIALTAYAMAGDRAKVLNAGFSGYIPKPIDVLSFNLRIEEQLPLHRIRLACSDDRPALRSILRRHGAQLVPADAQPDLLLNEQFLGTADEPTAELIQRIKDHVSQHALPDRV